MDTAYSINFQTEDYCKFAIPLHASQFSDLFKVSRRAQPLCFSRDNAPSRSLLFSARSVPKKKSARKSTPYLVTIIEILLALVKFIVTNL